MRPLAGASMGPDFISPEDQSIKVLPDKHPLASMGPDFISPEDDGARAGAATWEWLQWGGASLVRKQKKGWEEDPGVEASMRPDVISPEDQMSERGAEIRALLQWGRTSLVRKTTQHKAEPASCLSFNGAGLH